MLESIATCRLKGGVTAAGFARRRAKAFAF
jgi:hypothetical protein